MRSPLASPVQARIDGDVTGQVAVGSHILQIGSVHGDVVNVAAPAEIPRPRPRALPLRLLPRAFPGMLDRAGETDAAARALADERPVEVHGEEGIGRSSLLRRLAHHDVADAFPDGVVHLSARGHPAGDLAGLLWDAFHQCDVPYVPTAATLRADLRGRRALVVLDDVELDRAELETVMDAAPSCTFVWSCGARLGCGEARSLRLKGLPLEDAVRLVERELGRPLADGELPYAAALCDRLGCHPLRLLRAAARVRDEGATLAEVAADRAPPAADDAAARALLDALEAFVGASVGAPHLASIAGVDGAEAVLAALVRAHRASGEDGKFAAVPDEGEGRRP